VVTVADCEQVQASWFRRRAEVLGGEVWTDESLTWTDGPDGLNLMFPGKMTAAAVRRGVDRAVDRRLDIVGAWLSLDTDAAPLAEAGFERGWSPWWMTADLSQADDRRDPRIVLQQETSDYTGEHQSYREQLALARQDPPCAWYAAAYAEGPRPFAGRAWSFLDGDLAGVFDMAVWERFRRQGLGTGLLSAVCAAAREAGAQHSVLNATPEGWELYRRRGFTQIGEGITWWLHLNPP
jgi:GNAT superfamily N-acetyltransferase